MLEIKFSPQHHRLRGRVGDAAGEVALAAGAGEDQVGGRVHQLVPPHEDQAHHHRPLPRGQGGLHGPLSPAQVSPALGVSLAQTVTVIMFVEKRLP